MEKGLENIEEVFKQTFEGFEADVDPSVWSDIQMSIASDAGAESYVQPDFPKISILGKYLAFIISVGVIMMSSIAAGLYFLADTPKMNDGEVPLSDIPLLVAAKESTDLVLNDVFIDVDTRIKGNDMLLEEEEEEEVLSFTVLLENTDINNLSDVVSPIDNNIEISDKNVIKTKQEIVSAVTVRKVAKEEKAEPVISKPNHRVFPKESNDPKGIIKASVVKGGAPLDVDFYVEGVNLVSFHWNFGDNSELAKDESVFHTFEKPGSYKVELIIINVDAVSDTLIQYIEVENTMKPSLGFTPSAFSPNGDGNNDVYEFSSAVNIKTLYVQVMSIAKGNIVYEWNSIDEGWDGNDFYGKKLEAGNYSLSIHATGVDGQVLQENLIIKLYD